MKLMASLLQFLRKPKAKATLLALLTLNLGVANWGAASPSGDAQQTPLASLWPSHVTGSLIAQAPSSWFGAEHYVNYIAARSDLISQLKRANERVVVISSALTDPVVATRLHSLKLAGRTVLVLLEAKSERSYNSRHTYLTRASIPVYFGPIKAAGLGDPSYIIIDDHVLAMNTPLDSNATGRATLKDAGMSPDNLIGTINSTITLTRPSAQTTPHSSPSKPVVGAKASTSRQSVPGSRGGTIRLKARTPAVPQDTSAIPRSLPKRTRMGEIQAGNLPGAEPIEPLRRPKDEFLRLENEGELRAD